MPYDATEPYIRHRVHNPFRHVRPGGWRTAQGHTVVTPAALAQAGETLRCLPGGVIRLSRVVAAADAFLASELAPRRFARGGIAT